MLLGAIIARSSLSICRSSNLTWLDCQLMRSDKPIRLLIHPYPPPLCINTLPHPSCILTVRWAPWHRGAFAFDRPPLTCRTFPGGDETLTCLTQSGRPISQQHLLLAKDPSPILISNRLGNGNSQRDKTCRLLFSQDSFSAKLTSLPNVLRVYVLPLLLCLPPLLCYPLLLCLPLLACFQELAVFSRACCIQCLCASNKNAEKRGHTDLCFTFLVKLFLSLFSVHSVHVLFSSPTTKS